jgi:hypothetical protein
MSSRKDRLNIRQRIFYSASFQTYHLGQHTIVTYFLNLKIFEITEVTKFRQMEWWLWMMISDSSRMDRMMYFKVLSKYLAGGHEEKQKWPQSGQYGRELRIELENSRTRRRTLLFTVRFVKLVFDNPIWLHSSRWNSRRRLACRGLARAPEAS